MIIIDFIITTTFINQKLQEVSNCLRNLTLLFLVYEGYLRWLYWDMSFNDSWISTIVPIVICHSHSRLSSIFLMKWLVQSLLVHESNRNDSHLLLLTMIWVLSQIFLSNVEILKQRSIILGTYSISLNSHLLRIIFTMLLSYEGVQDSSCRLSLTLHFNLLLVMLVIQSGN